MEQYNVTIRIIEVHKGRDNISYRDLIAFQENFRIAEDEYGDLYANLNEIDEVTILNQVKFSDFKNKNTNYLSLRKENEEKHSTARTRYFKFDNYEIEVSF